MEIITKTENNEYKFCCFPTANIPYSMIAGGAFSILLYLCMLKDTPEQITYLGFSVYLLICQVFACRQVSVLYKVQRKEESLC